MKNSNQSKVLSKVLIEAGKKSGESCMSLRGFQRGLNAHLQVSLWFYVNFTIKFRIFLPNLFTNGHLTSGHQWSPDACLGPAPHN